MEILFISAERIVGGGETNLLCLALELARNGNTISILCHPKLGAFFERPSIRIITFSFSMRSWIKGYPLERTLPPDLIQICEDCDVIYLHSSNAIPYVACLATPKIWVCHGPWEVTSRAKLSYISNSCSRIYCVSETVKRHLMSLGANAHVSILPLGININHPTRNHSQASLSYPETCFQSLFLVLARFQFIKGQHIYIFSLYLLLLRNPSAARLIKTTFAGRWNSITSLIYYILVRAICLPLELIGIDIKFIGHTSSPISLIDDNHVVVVPSLYESYGMVCIEAMSRGRQVIVPSSTGSAEIVLSSSSGIIFKVGSAYSLSCALEKSITVKTNSGYRRRLMHESLSYDISVQASALQADLAQILNICQS